MNRAKVLMQCLLAVLVGSSCRSVDRFDTHDGETYCGRLLGQNDLSLGFEAPGWVGKSDRASVTIESLRTAQLFDKDGEVALLTSYDATYGPCSTQQSPLFARAPLRTIGKAQGDRLFNMQIAEDHEGDYVTFVDSTCSGSMVAILSLIQDGTIELRLLRPAPIVKDLDTALESTPRFGLFQLIKQKQGCNP
jgi:hypothetical protein